MRREPGIAATDTLLAVTTLTFDIAVLELLLPLTSGARVVIAGAEATVDGSRLQSLMAQFGVTLMQATPATWRLLLECGWTGSPDLKILCGGEAWSPELADKLLRRCGSLWNMYGPTETTIWSSTCKVEAGQPVLIGPPIANTTFYVLNAHCQPVPVGVPGELYIGGDGLARGYLNRSELTSERFIDDPFSRRFGARLYKTGDLVRYLPDRTIEFLGRIDRQVKIRGYRIELREIESVLNLHAAVRESVVVLEQDGSGEKRIVAYVVVSSPSSALIGELRDSLKQKLPTYMLPSAIVALDAFPLTPNGKLDYRALSSLATSPARASLDDQSQVLARTSTEEALVGIWREILKLDDIGIHDNFFDLGGHSLMAARLIGRINSIFNVTLTFLEIFQHPTIAQMATLIAKHGLIGSEGAIVVQLQGGKVGPPVYLFIGGPDEVRLAQSMGGERLIFGIEVPWRLEWHKATANNQTSILPNLEQLVAPHVEAVIAQTGSSPCVLGGYSFAGLMAFEAAHQLERRGVKIEMVMLLDTWLTLPPRHIRNWNKWQRDWKEVLNNQEQNRPYGSIGLLKSHVCS